MEYYELPDGWVWTTLGEVIRDAQTGFASGKKDIPDGTPHLRMNNVGANCRLNLDSVATVPNELAKPKYLLEQGDVLVCHTNSVKLIGKTALFDLPTRHYAFSNHLTRLRVQPNAADPRWLWRFLTILWREGYFETRCKQWVNQATIERETLLEVPISLPPLPEQHRIVARIDALFAQIRAARGALDTAPALIKQFRQSLLAAAFQGDLTERDPNDEPAATPIEDTELRDGWQWITVEKSCERIVDCLHSTPKFRDSGHICVDTNSIKPGQIVLDKIRYVDAATFAERNRRMKPQENDVMFSREGGLLGIAVKVPPNLEFCLGQRMMIFRLHPGVDAQYFEYYLNSSGFRSQYIDQITGTASPHLNIQDIRKLVIPVPSIDEQRVIATLIDSMFAEAANFDSVISMVRRQLDDLEQSILARAFQGELVPQDSDDEPASALLEQIRAQRVAIELTKKNAKPSRTK